MDLSAWSAPMRGFSQELMPEVVEILRAETTYDETGAETQDWNNPTVVSTTKCRITDAFGRESVIAEQLREVVEARVFMPLGTEVDVRDRLRLSNGLLYEVHSAPYNSNRNHEVVLVGRVT